MTVRFVVEREIRRGFPVSVMTAGYNLRKRGMYEIV